MNWSNTQAAVVTLYSSNAKLQQHVSMYVHFVDVTPIRLEN